MSDSQPKSPPTGQRRSASTSSRRTSLPAVSARKRAARFAAFDDGLTTKQRRYLDALLELTEASGGMPQQKVVAARAHVKPSTVSEWNRQPKFHEAVAAVMRRAAQPLIELVFRDLCYRAMRTGSAKHYELALRAAGRLDADPIIAINQGAPVAAQAAVTFVGLPQPPTPQQAEAMRPPVGSAAIVRQTLPGVIVPESTK